MTADKEQVSAYIIGARCLQEILPDWVAQGGAGGYTKLHVGELHELLRLRGEDEDGMKPQLIEWLEYSDYKNYGGPKPVRHVLRDARPIKIDWEALGRPPLVPTHKGEQENARTNSDNDSGNELHIRVHTALELEHDINLPCKSRTVAARAEAEDINDSFGDRQIRVKQLECRVVEELCKLRDIYNVTTEEDLRADLLVELKRANLKSETYMNNLRKEVLESKYGQKAQDMSYHIEFRRLTADCKMSLSDLCDEEHSKFAGLAKRSAQDRVREDIETIVSELPGMINEASNWYVDFDATFYGARLFCMRLPEYFPNSGFLRTDYPKFTKNELLEISRQRGNGIIGKTKQMLIDQLLALDRKRHYEMWGWKHTPEQAAEWAKNTRYNIF